MAKRICPLCHGTGRVTCDICHGTGYVWQKTSKNVLTLVQGEDVECIACLGSGRQICNLCAGTGRVEDEK